MANPKFTKKVRSDEEQTELVMAAQRLNKTLSDIGARSATVMAQKLAEAVKPRFNFGDLFKNYWTPPPVPPIQSIPLTKTTTIPKPLRYVVEPEAEKIKLKEKEDREKESLRLQIESVEYQLLDYQHKKSTFLYTRIGVPVSIIISVLVLVVVLFDTKLEFTKAYSVGFIGLGILLLGVAVFLAVRSLLNRKNQEPTE